MPDAVQRYSMLFYYRANVAKAFLSEFSGLGCEDQAIRTTIDYMMRKTAEELGYFERQMGIGTGSKSKDGLLVHLSLKGESLLASSELWKKRIGYVMLCQVNDLSDLIRNGCRAEIDYPLAAETANA